MKYQYNPKKEEYRILVKYPETDLQEALSHVVFPKIVTSQVRKSKKRTPEYLEERVLTIVDIYLNSTAEQEPRFKKILINALKTYIQEVNSEDRLPFLDTLAKLFGIKESNSRSIEGELVPNDEISKLLEEPEEQEIRERGTSLTTLGKMLVGDFMNSSQNYNRIN